MQDVEKILRNGDLFAPYGSQDPFHGLEQGFDFRQVDGPSGAFQAVGFPEDRLYARLLFIFFGGFL